MDKRRVIRAGPRVIHRHRVGSRVFRRVSELVFTQGKAKALLGWVDLGGVRTPLYICELDRAKLRSAKGVRGLYYYDDTTVDPRFADPIDDLTAARMR
jgi:hypothetical protein